NGSNIDSRITEQRMSAALIPRIESVLNGFNDPSHMADCLHSQMDFRTVGGPPASYNLPSQAAFMSDDDIQFGRLRYDSRMGSKSAFHQMADPSEREFLVHGGCQGDRGGRDQVLRFESFEGVKHGSQPGFRVAGASAIH